MPKELKDTDEKADQDFIGRDFPSTDLGEADEPTRRSDDQPTNRSADKAIDPQDGQSASRPADKEAGQSANKEISQLARQIQFLVDELPPYQGESLSEKTNGYISEATDRALRDSLHVLERRYGKHLTKSQVYEHLLRWALRDMQERAEDSLIIELLDAKLER
jgi:hypothetical protein